MLRRKLILFMSLKAYPEDHIDQRTVSNCLRECLLLAFDQQLVEHGCHCS